MIFLQNRLRRLSGSSEIYNVDWEVSILWTFLRCLFKRRWVTDVLQCGQRQRSRYLDVLYLGEAESSKSTIIFHNRIPSCSWTAITIFVNATTTTFLHFIPSNVGYLDKGNSFNLIFNLVKVFTQKYLYYVKVWGKIPLWLTKKRFWHRLSNFPKS